MSGDTGYDVVVVGAGVNGALIAKHLTHAKLRVLVLEAGPATAWTFDGYTRHLGRFYSAANKGVESPWPPAANAPQPDTADVRSGGGYFVHSSMTHHGVATDYLGSRKWLSILYSARRS